MLNVHAINPMLSRPTRAVWKFYKSTFDISCYWYSRLKSTTPSAAFSARPLRWGTVVEAAAQHLSIGSLFPSYQIMKCRIQISVKLLIWIVLIGPSITSCDVSMLSFSSTPGIAIHNNLFRYGMYCGPGPDDKLWAVTQPVDSIDQTCQDHDKAYRKCLRNLSKDTGMHHTRLDTIVSRIGLELSIPSRMNFSSSNIYEHKFAFQDSQCRKFSTR